MRSQTDETLSPDPAPGSTTTGVPSAELTTPAAISQTNHSTALAGKVKWVDQLTCQKITFGDNWKYVLRTNDLPIKA